MAEKFEEMGPGLKVRIDTPKKVPLTQEFVRDLTKGSDSKTFTETIQEIAETASTD